MPNFYRHLASHQPEATFPSIALSASHAPPHVHRDGKSLLDLMMPEYHFRGTAKVAIDASPEAVLRALEEVTLAEMPLARTIGTLRYLPGRLTGRERPPDDLLAQPFLKVATPFLRLGEDPGREIVIGSVGKFHNMLDQQFVDLPDLFTFTRFNDADYQKLAMNLRAGMEDGGQRTILSSDHRTLALSPAARRKFAVYWYLMVGWGGNFMLRQLLRAVKRHAEAGHLPLAPDPLPVTANRVPGWRGQLTELLSLKRLRNA
jgi:hypothetical protein